MNSPFYLIDATFFCGIEGRLGVVYHSSHFPLPLEKGLGVWLCFVGFSDKNRALRRRSFRANSLLLRFLRILGIFYKVLKLSDIWKIPLLALYQKAFLTKNSLENFWSSRRYDMVISPFWSHQKAFLTKSTYCFLSEATVFWYLHHRFP